MKEQTFIIPEGFELKQTGDNQFTIVPKQQQTQQRPVMPLFETQAMDVQTPGNLDEIRRRQMQEVANRRYENNFFRPREVRNDYDFDDDEIIRGKSREDLFEERYGGENSFNILQSMYKNGRLKKLNRHEMELLRFCHGIDVKKFIKEEFERNPIELAHDENGNIYVKNPHKPVDLSDDRDL